MNSNTVSKHIRTGQQSGAVAAEFAIVCLVILFFVLTFFDFGRFYYFKGLSSASAQRGLSLAQLIDGLDTLTASTNDDIYNLSDPKEVAVMQAIEERALDFAQKATGLNIVDYDANQSLLKNAGIYTPETTLAETQKHLITLPEFSPSTRTLREALAESPIDIYFRVWVEPVSPWLSPFIINVRASGYRERELETALPNALDCRGRNMNDPDYDPNAVICDCPGDPDSGLKFDPVSQTCVPVCLGQVVQSLDDCCNGQGPDAVYNPVEDTCECPLDGEQECIDRGMVWTGNLPGCCVCPDSCPGGLIPNPNAGTTGVCCICPAGTVQVSDSGTCCAEGSVYIEEFDTCCPAGSDYIDEFGVCCPEGVDFNQDYGVCCPDGWVFHESAGKCCAPGDVPDENGNCSPCPIEQLSSDGLSCTCPCNQVRNPFTADPFDCHCGNPNEAPGSNGCCECKLVTSNPEPDEIQCDIIKEGCQCQQCEGNFVVNPEDPTRCDICPYAENPIDLQGFCREDERLSLTECECFKCGPNFIRDPSDPTECSCPPNFQDNCDPATEVFNATRCSCDGICDPAVVNVEECVCQSNQTDCNEDEIFEPNNCHCKPCQGKFLNPDIPAGQCRCTLDFDEDCADFGQVRDPSAECNCVDCRDLPGNNDNFDIGPDGSCQCQLNEEICAQTDEVFQGSARCECLPCLDADFEFNPTTRQCECKQEVLDACGEATANSQTCECECPGGQIFNNGSCECPVGQIEDNGTCGCPGARVLNASGQCVCPACPISGQSPDASCTCRCPTGQQVVGNRCACPSCPIAGQVAGPGCSCQCPDGQVISAGQCVRPCEITNSCNEDPE